MKYCKKCKLAAKETETVCVKCGSPVSTFGALKPASAAPIRPPADAASRPPAVGATRPPTAAPTRPQPSAPSRPTAPGPSGGGGPARPSASPTMFSLGGEVQRLIEEKQKNIRRGKGLSLLSLLVALAITILLYEIYSRTVLAYAILENIKFEQDPVAEGQLTISFDVKTPGLVAFDRRSGRGHTEKIDLIATKEGHKTVWAWPSDPKTGIDLSVVSRGGWLLTSEARHFDVTRSGIGVEVVFLMDITSSMGPYIEILKKQCLDFADAVTRQGLDCRLGLVAFGDVDYNEPLLPFDPATPKEFREHVSALELTDGHDAPESSVEALEKALDMEFRPHTRVCFVHITDASCHNRDRIQGLAKALRDKSVVTYVVSQSQLRQVYKPLCVNGGVFYGDLQSSSFAAILKEIAKSLVNTIKSE